MKYLTIILCTIGLLIACGSETSSTESAVAATADTPPDGQKIYKINCVTCHGLYGDMGASGAYDLTSSELTLEERIAVITNGRNTMMPYKNLLDEDEIQAVAEYTMELTKE